MCPSGQHGLDYRGQICDLCRSTFKVWPKDGSDVDARTSLSPTAKQAAEQRAREDWRAGAMAWPATYCVRDGLRGTLWDISVTLAMEPTFVADDIQEIPMASSTHVLWGGRVLCEDLRLRHVPRDWPDGQRWISLKSVADGTARPNDGCGVCWNKAPELVDGLWQIGSDR
jgi:hypothetical protein